jgi:hypothetical protein
VRQLVMVIMEFSEGNYLMCSNALPVLSLPIARSILAECPSHHPSLSRPSLTVLEIGELGLVLPPFTAP